MKYLLVSFLIFVSVLVFSQDNTTDSTNAPSNNNSSSTNTSSNNIYNGWELFQEGRYSESISALQREMQSFPNRINIYVILGWDYYYLRRYADMENISQVGLKIKPNDTRLIRNLAESCFYQGKYQNAIDEFEKYISYNYNQNDPYLPSAYYYSGICYFNLTSYRKADIALSTANYLQPNNYRIILMLAETKEKLQDLDNAKKHFEKVLQLKANEIKAIDGLQRINKDNKE